MALDEITVGRAVTPLVEAAGYDLERIRVARAGAKSVVTVVVDTDGGPSLDDVAELSRAVSAAIDDDPDFGKQAFTLEVTTPGAERPLTAPRHWRRARGRMAAIELADGTNLSARVGELAPDEAEVTVVLPDRRKGPTVRTVALADVRRASVRVEFGVPDRRELELSGVAPGRPVPGVGPVIGAGDGSDDDEFDDGSDDDAGADDPDTATTTHERGDK
ncbi:ribosome maturation factor RimP [Tsukamurella soli]|uniref:Ribosome maturation factor RimP n=1 Tax=Tsukamurella soli TaxID=644556 RepID=A0ABP8KJT3_9ACTN